ncbi:MAG: N-formylglutamate amidohydrolase [Spirochaetes bacterium]|nr:N-formylglutamate amidohydrolase [Spirochaetota bacterium]
MKSIPFLIIVPHGGIQIPDELREYTAISDFDLLLNSDAFANDIFNFEDKVFECICASISRLFVDLDRSLLEVPPAHNDGVIKKLSTFGKPIYKENNFPDEIAISAIIQRYYIPFYERINNFINRRKIKCIIECHTMMPVAPASAPDAGKPRPLLSVQNTIQNSKGIVHTAPMEVAEEFLRILAHQFRKEANTVTERFTLNSPSFRGNLLKTFGSAAVPMIRLSVSRSLYFTDEFLDLNKMSIEKYRLISLQQKFLQSIELFYRSVF